MWHFSFSLNMHIYALQHLFDEKHGVGGNDILLVVVVDADEVEPGVEGPHVKRSPQFLNSTWVIQSVQKGWWGEWEVWQTNEEKGRECKLSKFEYICLLVEFE